MEKRQKRGFILFAAGIFCYAASMVVQHHYPTYEFLHGLLMGMGAALMVFAVIAFTMSLRKEKPKE